MVTAENNLQAISYIATFFNDIEQLNNLTGAFSNLKVDFSKKYPSFEEKTPIENIRILAEKLDPQENQQLKNTCETIRIYSTRIFIKINALKDRLELTNFEEINKYYQEIKNEPVPLQQTIENFVIELNKIFVSKVADELLRSTQDYYRNIQAGLNG